MLIILDCYLQALLEQTSIQNLILRGRGEVLLCRGLATAESGLSAFDLGAVSYLTILHIKTDGFVRIRIPATMRLQSLEIYAPSMWLSAESLQGWASHLIDLRLVYGDSFALQADDEDEMILLTLGPPFWSSMPELPGECERLLYAVFFEAADAPNLKYDREDKGSAYHTLQCLVLEGCKFDTGMPAAVSVYNGGMEACSCGICWVCLQQKNGY